MDQLGLRALQGPLKDAYRASPERARVIARAVGVLEPTDVACRVTIGDGERRAGLHPATGGTGALACSADMLMEALVACAGVTLSAVATALAIPIRGGRITAEGTWDARGTLGVDRTASVGLTHVALQFTLDSPAADDALQRLIAMTERYCVILHSLRTPVPVDSSWDRNA
jgi:uncharacterized OsmC-like protein